MLHNRSVWIGFDPTPSAALAYAVARASTKRRLTQSIPINGLVLDDLRSRGLYMRPTDQRNGQMWDVISQAPCATQFSISRFLVPYIAREGYALFMDCDVLVRTNLVRLFDHAEMFSQYAVMCVKHQHIPDDLFKMDGKIQTTYARKNWSSVMMFNCGHPANKALTTHAVNTLPGRDLHRLCWLDDSEIGELSVAWNWLAGHSDPSVDPYIVHHTDGVPAIPGYEDAPFASEWREELNRLAA